MRYRHRTLDGLHDLVKAWVESQNYADNGGASFETLHNVDLLIINMGADPPNQHYHDLFVSLLEKRRLKGLYTWVLLPYHLDDASFRRIYRADTVRYIHEWFSIMKLHQAVDAVSKT
jgi:DNA replication protein DnaC